MLGTCAMSEAGTNSIYYDADYMVVDCINLQTKVEHLKKENKSLEARIGGLIDRYQNQAESIAKYQRTTYRYCDIIAAQQAELDELRKLLKDILEETSSCNNERKLILYGD